MKIKNCRYKYIHQNGCGKVGFYFDSVPGLGVSIPAELVVFPDGTQPKIGDYFYCGSCGETFKNPVIEYVSLNDDYVCKEYEEY